MESFIGLTIIDKQRVLITEVKDDAKIDYVDVVGMTIYIEGKYTALSYTTIFNSLWKQTELYEKLEKAFEKIQIHDKMQAEIKSIEFDLIDSDNDFLIYADKARINQVISIDKQFN